MGKRNRALRLDSEWKANYCREATGIIVELAKHIQQVPPELLKRITRLRAASYIYDEIQKKKETFVP